MAATPSNLLAGLAGNASAFELCWVADFTGLVAPTNATTALDVTFKSLGLVTTDGATTSTAMSNNDIMSFGSYSPVRTLVSQEVLTVHFVAQETNKVTAAIKTRQALSAVTLTSGALSLTRGPARDALYGLVIDALDGTNHIRKFYPKTRLTGLGDQQVGFAQGVFYDFTFTCYADATGVAEYEYDTGLT